jgi:hypothetical protein
MIDPGLFLSNAPLLCGSALSAVEMRDELRPLDAGLDLDNVIVQIQSQHPFEVGQIHEDHVGAELLAALGVPTSANGQSAALARGGADRRLNLL